MRKALLLGLALALAAPIAATIAPATRAEASGGCGGGYYRNARSHCVPRPVHARRAPAGASARCRDGSYSFSQSRRGACSWHGGVAAWLY